MRIHGGLRPGHGAERHHRLGKNDPDLIGIGELASRRGLALTILSADFMARAWQDRQ